MLTLIFCMMLYMNENLCSIYINYVLAISVQLCQLNTTAIPLMKHLNWAASLKANVVTTKPNLLFANQSLIIYN